jgi:hypothetical protein
MMLGIDNTIMPISQMVNDRLLLRPPREIE